MKLQFSEAQMAFHLIYLTCLKTTNTTKHQVPEFKLTSIQNKTAWTMVPLSLEKALNRKLDQFILHTY